MLRVIILLILIGYITPIDLSEEKLYTISDSSKQILKNIRKTKIRLFYSKETALNMPETQEYYARTKTFLYELGKYSDNLTIEEINPKLFSKAEDMAIKFGIKPITIDDFGNKLYFGLAVTNNENDYKVISFLDSAREDYLEYDIVKIIYELYQTDRKKIAVMSWLPIAGKVRPWEILKQINSQYEVSFIDNYAQYIDPNYDLLLLIHPQNISYDTESSIEDYLFAGGKAMIFVDPHSEFRSMSHNIESTSSNLNRLFEEWGIEFTNKVVLDDNLKATIYSDNKKTNLISWLNITKNNISSLIPTAKLDDVLLPSVGYLESKKIDIKPILQSTTNSSLIVPEKLNYLVNPKILESNFVADSKKYILAAEVNSEVKSAFGDIRGSISAVIFADTDFIQDRFWLHSVDPVISYNDNAKLVLNYIDYYIGTKELIGLRSRKKIIRRLDYIDKKVNEANVKYLVQEKKLKKKLKDIEDKISDLKTKPNSYIFTQKQSQLVNQFQTELINTRDDLRSLRYSFNQEMDFISNIVKVLNILFLPFILIILSFYIPRRILRK